MEILGFILLFIIFSISDAAKGDTTGLEIIGGIIGFIIGVFITIKCGIVGLIVVLVIIVAIACIAEGGKKS